MILAFFHIEALVKVGLLTKGQTDVEQLKEALNFRLLRSLHL